MESSSDNACVLPSILYHLELITDNDDLCKYIYPNKQTNSIIQPLFKYISNATV